MMARNTLAYFDTLKVTRIKRFYRTDTSLKTSLILPLVSKL
jgi:hypothetical protein